MDEETRALIRETVRAVLEEMGWRPDSDVTATCPRCGGFLPARRRKDKVYCSDRCAGAARQARRRGT